MLGSGVAAGRIPNTEGSGLESGGIELTDRGYIKVNRGFETKAPCVWAIGEIGSHSSHTSG